MHAAHDRIPGVCVVPDDRVGDLHDSILMSIMAYAPASPTPHEVGGTPRFFSFHSKENDHTEFPSGPDQDLSFNK